MDLVAIILLIAALALCVALGKRMGMDRRSRDAELVKPAPIARGRYPNVSDHDYEMTRFLSSRSKRDVQDAEDFAHEQAILEDQYPEPIEGVPASYRYPKPTRDSRGRFVKG